MSGSLLSKFLSQVFKSFQSSYFIQQPLFIAFLSLFKSLPSAGNILYREYIGGIEWNYYLSKQISRVLIRSQFCSKKRSFYVQILPNHGIIENISCQAALEIKFSKQLLLTKHPGQVGSWKDPLYKWLSSITICLCDTLLLPSILQSTCPFMRYIICFVIVSFWEQSTFILITISIMRIWYICYLEYKFVSFSVVHKVLWAFLETQRHE